MKQLFVILGVGFALSTFAAQMPAKGKANCELHLVTEAGAGEIFLTMITSSKEECLSKSDSAVEARFRSKSGEVTATRGGAGPQP